MSNKINFQMFENKNSYEEKVSNLIYKDNITPLILEWFFSQVCSLMGQQEIILDPEKMADLFTKLGRFTIASDFMLGDGFYDDDD